MNIYKIFTDTLFMTVTSFLFNYQILFIYMVYTVLLGEINLSNNLFRTESLV